MREGLRDASDIRKSWMEQRSTLEVGWWDWMFTEYRIEVQAEISYPD